MEPGIGSVTYEEEFILNSRGKQLFTCRWMPPHDSEPKGLIFLCHGYGMASTISMRGCGIRLAKAGYACYGIDYEGHGKSSGLHCYIPNFDDLVTDCSHHFTTISEREENKKKKRILMGESMGGAVVLLLHRKNPHYWDMAVLVAPMCKIADEMKPYPVLIDVMDKLVRLIPTWKIVPGPDIIDVAFRAPEIRNEVRSNPLCYKGRPRLATGVEVMRVSLDLEKRIEEVSLPLIVLHGGEDKVIDPRISKLLYESALSSDKTLKLYPSMWHSLTYGELPQNQDMVFRDIVNWLDERVDSGDPVRINFVLAINWIGLHEQTTKSGPIMEKTSWVQRLNALTHILTNPTTTPPLHSQLFIATQIPCYLNWDYPPLLCPQSSTTAAAAAAALSPPPLMRWAFSQFLKRARRFGLPETSWRSKCPYLLPPPLVLANGVEEARWGEEERINYVRTRLRRKRLGSNVNPLIPIIVPNLLLFSLLFWDPITFDEA